jgi:molecular chaperone GrpE
VQDTSDPRTDVREPRRNPDPEPASRSAEDEAAEAAEAAEAGTPEPESPPAGESDPGSVEAIDYKDRWLRAEAELQNFRRRARRELDETRRAAEEAALLDLVALLDDLERAHRAAGEAGAPGPWSEGVALVLQKGRDYLERQGVSVVDPMGQPFDPRFHEAILEIGATEDVAPGTVTQVVHRGYRRGERALRAARVVVAGGETDEG